MARIFTDGLTAKIQGNFYILYHAKRYHNIHDIFVRESFSDSERAVAFFERFLPETIIHHLNLATLTVLKETYINETLKEYFSDLVFEVSLKSDNGFWLVLKIRKL